MGLDLGTVEPEETVGKLVARMGHKLRCTAGLRRSGGDAGRVTGRIAVLFRGLGGAAAVEIRPAAEQTSHHRIGWRRKLGMLAETVPAASFDGETLRLPERLSVLPTRQANGALYLWLAGLRPRTPPRPARGPPLARDLARIGAARRAVQATLDDAPGLGGLVDGLAALVLKLRLGHLACPRPRPMSRR